MKTSIIVFELNEIDGMRAMMPQIKKEWYDELIIVDGGSTDGTIEFANKSGYALFVQREKGVGAALNEAIKKTTGDIILLYAPDGSFEVDRIPLMVEKINEGYDIVSITRYGYGGKSFDDTVFTAAGNRLFTAMVNLLFGAQFRVTDFLYTYVAFRRQLLKDLEVDTTLITGPQILMLRAIKGHKRILEVPGNEPKRIGGDVKVNKLGTAWIILTTILRERFSWK